MNAPLPGYKERTTRLYRIAELMRRYRPWHDHKASKWRLMDLESDKAGEGALLPAKYDDEESAKAGARLAAACDIDALYDTGVKS